MRGTPPLLCAFSLGRDGYCTELYRHAGEHRCDPALMPGQTTDTSPSDGAREDTP